jgi:hypothetical protein
MWKSQRKPTSNSYATPDSSMTVVRAPQRRNRLADRKPQPPN